VPELPKCSYFELAHTLPRHPKQAADLKQRMAVQAVKPVAQDDHYAFTPWKRGKHRQEFATGLVPAGHIIEWKNRFILDALDKRQVLVLAKQLIQAEHLLASGTQCLYFGDRYAQALSKFRITGRFSTFSGELGGCRCQASDLHKDMGG
jgi:hypothetical protein